MKTVSLVLGSGGARGLAHIGVIRWLEEHDYRITCIAASSIGAVVGGIYAAGKLDEFEKWVRAITRVDIMTFLDVAWGKGGLVKGDRIINALVDLVGEQAIEDLPIRFTAVATDIMKQREVWLSSGSLFQAIRASMSVPLLFTPCSIDGTDYVDGAVLNPLPVAAALGANADLAVAVHCGGLSAKPREVRTSMTLPPMFPSTLGEKIRHFLQHLQPMESSDSGRDWGTYEVAILSFEAMQNSLAQQKLAAHPPDALIEIPRNACRTLEYDRADEMIELGYENAANCFESLVLPWS